MILCISVLVVRIPDLDIPHDFVRFYQLNLSPSTCDDALNRNGYWSMVYKLYIEWNTCCAFPARWLVDTRTYDVDTYIRAIQLDIKIACVCMCVFVYGTV